MRASIRALTCVTFWLATSALVPVTTPAHAQGTETAEVLASPISRFRLNSDESRFGKFEFLGGLVMSSQNSLFGALSSIRMLPGGRDFIMVADTGHWVTGRIERDSQGRLSGLDGVRITSMKDGKGRSDRNKFAMDSESLALRDGNVLVSFERRHRVDVYPGPDFITALPAQSLPLGIPKKELKGNGGLETIAVSPVSSPLKGGAVVVAERSVDSAGNLLGSILDGPLKGQFTVRHTDSFDVSDGTFLPMGDMLLLQRRFSLATGIGLRIVRIKASDIRPGAIVDGDVILDADMGEQIDNMEGIDAFQAADGSTRVILVSDDNHSLFQRSLMLEFRLLGD